MSDEIFSNNIKAEIFDLKLDLCKNVPFFDHFLPIFSGMTDPIRIKLFTRDSTRGALSSDTKFVPNGQVEKKICVLENESRTKFS